VVDTLELIAVTRRRIRQNLGWALAYNATAIPLAMAGMLNPLFAALAMSASSLLVVWNAVRPILRDESNPSRSVHFRERQANVAGFADPALHDK